MKATGGQPGRGQGDLRARLADPGFTPSIRGLPELLELVGDPDEDLAKSAERAVLKIEPQYAARVARETVTRASAAVRPARGRLTRLAGRLAAEARDPEGIVLPFLLGALEDEDPKTRRAAARALGKLEATPSIEAALARAFDATKNADDRRALALALGKTGGDEARARLSGGEHTRAAVIVEREHARRTPGAIDPSRAHRSPLRIWFHTRSGLEDVVKDEAGGKTKFAAPGVVEGTLTGPLSEALRVRTATHVGFPLDKVDASSDLADDIVAAITSEPALTIFRAFTDRAEGGAIRFRLAFTKGGHQRAVAWKCAELVRTRTTELVNDPQDSTWEVAVDVAGRSIKIELVPRGWSDERFAYRESVVPASSHPVIAAALARVAPRSEKDVVWDPFVGAGAELVERAKLGPYARLVGSDTEDVALAAAKANLDRAKVDRYTLAKEDGAAYAPDGVTLIVTNPPMGRRVQRGTHADLLERFVSHAARVLVPGGSLVWLVPEPKIIRARAETAGLALERGFTVDMGGFSAELAVYVKRGPRTAIVGGGRGPGPRGPRATPPRQGRPPR